MIPSRFPFYYPRLEVLPTHRRGAVVVVVTAEVAASRAIVDVHSGGNTAVDAAIDNLAGEIAMSTTFISS